MQLHISAIQQPLYYRFTEHTAKVQARRMTVSCAMCALALPCIRTHQRPYVWQLETALIRPIDFEFNINKYQTAAYENWLADWQTPSATDWPLTVFESILLRRLLLSWQEHAVSYSVGFWVRLLPVLLISEFNNANTTRQLFFSTTLKLLSLGRPFASFSFWTPRFFEHSYFTR